MDIVKQGDSLVDAKTASKMVFQSMFNGTIMVLLGGFTIAAALSKHGIAQAFASVVLSRAGTKPSVVVLVNMYLAAFLSMWISNVATPVFCTALVEVKADPGTGNQITYIFISPSLAYTSNLTTQFNGGTLSDLGHCLG
jgi:di/tricarboxylate transporter